MKKNKLNEAPVSSSSIFGGKNVTIPKDGAHSGQSGWQSSEAWDLKASIGTPVYSLTTGSLETFNDYGTNVIKTGGKKLYGVSFTVKGDTNMPDVYYTHLSNVNLRKGDRVECGQLLGYVMDFPGSDYDHVHIGVKPPAKISDLIDSNGNIKCGGGKFLKSDEKETEKGGDVSSTDTTKKYVPKDPLLMNILKGFDYLTGLNENNKILINKYEYLVENKTYSSFGKNVISVGKSLILSAKDNPKIKSPVDGKTQNFTYNPSCQNQIVIKFQHNNENFYLEYCGIDRLSIGKNSNVGAGTKLGETSTDVNVNLYNSNYQKTYFDEILKTKGEDFKKDRKDGISKGYKDPLLIGLTQLPGKLLKKIWASPTDSDQPESFASKWNPTKKVNENIEKIKRLLK